jgi:hypothetical protein
MDAVEGRKGALVSYVYLRGVGKREIEEKRLFLV